MTKKTTLGRWRSPRAERRFETLERQLWAEFRRPWVRVDADTPRGTTRAVHWIGEGDPIVFLHGMGGTGVIWAPYAEALAGRDVWAIDTLGDAGYSVQRVPYANADEMGESLQHALAGLGITRAQVVGHSLGGWLALNLITRRPDRVASAVLLDPVGLAELDMRAFLRWGLPVLAGAIAPASVRAGLARRYRMPLLKHKAGIRLALHGQLGHTLGIPRPGVFSDDELVAIATPTTVMVGARTEPFDAAELTRRAALIPGARVELVADAGHAFPVDHADVVIDAMTTLSMGKTRGL